MSYDIVLFARDGSNRPAIEDLGAFFRQRANYTMSSAGGAGYHNALTDVSFRVSFDAGSEDEELIRITAPSGASHTRALELVEEIEAIAAAFGLLIDDPTMDGMGKGELDRETLLRGCLFASRFGLVVDITLGRLTDQTVRVYDQDRLTAYWRWNRMHSATQAAMGDGVFVPQISFVATKRAVLAIVAWTGTMPTLLPEVDAIVTIDTSSDGPSKKTVATADLAKALARFPVRDAPARHRVIEPTPAVRAAIAKAAPVRHEATQVRFGDVLGAAFWQATKDHHVQWSGGQNQPRKPAKAAKAKAKAPAPKTKRRTGATGKAATTGRTRTKALSKRTAKR